MRILSFLFFFIVAHSLPAQEITVEPAVEFDPPIAAEEESKSATIAFTENGKYGIKDLRTGKIILPAEYDHVNEERVKDHFIVTRNSRRGLFHAGQRTMIVP
ncbi:MAG TPA: hypothetical protein VIT44_05180, partial [Cyclobacteriaceae bacterium]